MSRIVEGKLADGLILSGTTPQDERVRYMLERRFPFVTFGRTELFTPHPGTTSTTSWRLGRRPATWPRKAAAGSR